MPTEPGPEDCHTHHPAFGVPCIRATHPHTQAHYARGGDDDCTWTLFWWSPAAQRTRPTARADDRVIGP